VEVRRAIDALKSVYSVQMSVILGERKNSSGGNAREWIMLGMVILILPGFIKGQTCDEL